MANKTLQQKYDEALDLITECEELIDSDDTWGYVQTDELRERIRAFRRENEEQS